MKFSNQFNNPSFKVVCIWNKKLRVLRPSINRHWIKSCSIGPDFGSIPTLDRLGSLDRFANIAKGIDMIVLKFYNHYSMSWAGLAVLANQSTQNQSKVGDQKSYLLNRSKVAESNVDRQNFDRSTDIVPLKSWKSFVGNLI